MPRYKTLRVLTALLIVLCVIAVPIYYHLYREARANWIATKTAPDRLQSSVPLQNAKYPTMEGVSHLEEPVAPDIKSEAIWDGRKVMPFRSIDYPRMVQAAKADFLNDNDYILGITANGESRAYPTRYVFFHHAVNDKIGKPKLGQTYVAITYCGVCNTGIRYDPIHNGRPVLFDFYGLYNGMVALCDRKTESVFLQGEGRVINGPLIGIRFKTGPLLDTTWGQWKKLHPDTLVMSPDTPYIQFYHPKGYREQRDYTSFPGNTFASTVTRGDLRLRPFDKVLAVTQNRKHAPTMTALHRAYPIETLVRTGDVVNDTLGAVPIAVWFDPNTAAAVAVSRRVDGKTLTFEARKQPDSTTAFYDRETGTRWSIEGLGEEGALAGKKLQRLDSHLSRWYGWAASFPDTSIYGRNDPPQPGNPFAL